MDALRRSVRTSKLDRKTNEYIRGKMDAQDMILDDITRKQLIWYGHVERMDSTRVPEIMIHWKPEGRKKRGRPRVGKPGRPQITIWRMRVTSWIPMDTNTRSEYVNLIILPLQQWLHERTLMLRLYVHCLYC